MPRWLNSAGCNETDFISFELNATCCFDAIVVFKCLQSSWFRTNWNGSHKLLQTFVLANILTCHKAREKTYSICSIKVIHQSIVSSHTIPEPCCSIKQSLIKEILYKINTYLLHLYLMSWTVHQEMVHYTQKHMGPTHMYFCYPFFPVVTTCSMFGEKTQPMLNWSVHINLRELAKP